MGNAHPPVEDLTDGGVAGILSMLAFQFPGGKRERKESVAPFERKGVRATKP